MEVIQLIWTSLLAPGLLIILAWWLDQKKK